MGWVGRGSWEAGIKIKSCFGLMLDVSNMSYADFFDMLREK